MANEFQHRPELLKSKTAVYNLQVRFYNKMSIQMFVESILIKKGSLAHLTIMRSDAIVLPEMGLLFIASRKNNAKLTYY